jgi:hypothetical protein
MQNAGRGIWRKFSGLSRERQDGGHPNSLLEYTHAFFANSESLIKDYVNYLT